MRVSRTELVQLWWAMWATLKNLREWHSKDQHCCPDINGFLLAGFASPGLAFQMEGPTKKLKSQHYSMTWLTHANLVCVERAKAQKSTASMKGKIFKPKTSELPVKSEVPQHLGPVNIICRAQCKIKMKDSLLIMQGK